MFRFALHCILAICLGAMFIVPDADAGKIKLPYKKAGLNKKQAAAHLLERFAFGARPGEVNRVAKMGPEKWLAQQLEGTLPDAQLEKRLKAFPAVAMTTAEIVATHPKNGYLRKEMSKAGILDVEKMKKKEINNKMKAYRKEKGLRTLGQLTNQDLPGQKLVRAVYSENQLREVLTDFWFNHFNVTIRDGAARHFVLSYEQDAIRSNALGQFRTLLGATAKHPAMLHYLDNTQSRAPQQNQQNQRRNRNQQNQTMAADNEMGGEMGGEMASGKKPGQKAAIPKPPPKRQKRGLNENYARELMELHTLGVDGGYTQKDVVEVARALTGWGAFPVGNKSILKNMKRNPQNFVHEGDFLYRRFWHDRKAKVILGETFPAGGGVEEGERVLNMLAKHPSTARFISTKLARRFVSDKPSETLINHLSDTFTKTRGDIKAMMITLAQSPEFWAEAKTRSKLKSPFTLASSALRALEADVKNPRPTLNWITRMGEPLYRYLPPTGFPDYAESWANTGTLVTRMNFGIGLVTGRIGGVVINLPTKGKNNSTNELLKTYSKILLPEQEAKDTLNQVKITVPENAQKKDVQVIALLLGSPEFQYH
ncbi:MAG: DUF1800 domain-containing protein [bacterium]|nr:DUF1800 domain-containing protein [bacterium]